MNFKTISLSVLLLALLTACGSAPTTPLAVPTAAPTTASVSEQQIPADTPQPATLLITVAPTAAPQPTALPTAMAPTVESSTATGPQLIVPNADGLQAFSVDGINVQSFEQAHLTLGRTLSEGSAPRGNRVAFIGGDNPMTPDREGSGPLMLNLLDTRTGRLQPITPLFSPEMEQALQEASITGERDASVEAGIAVAENANTLAWSPDGRYLAFIAAIDGPSSDVYSYDRESGTINRLTDGLNQAARLFWSPDSQWIIHEEVESFGTGAGWNVKAVWAAAPDGSGNRKLYDREWSGDEVFVDWVSPESFLVYSWTPLGLQDIRLIDLTTGEARHSGLDYPVRALAFDPTSRAQLVTVDDYIARENDMQVGLHFTSGAEYPKLVAPGNWYDVRWLPHARIFFAKGEEGVIGVALDGTITEYSGEEALPIDSPDGAWLLAWGDGNYTNPIGLRLYTTDGQLRRDITQDSVAFATWAPDSSGLFYVSDGMLYYVAIPNGEPQLIAEDLISSEAGSVGWVRP